MEALGRSPIPIPGAGLNPMTNHYGKMISCIEGAGCMKPILPPRQRALQAFAIVMGIAAILGFTNVYLLADETIPDIPLISESLRTQDWPESFIDSLAVWQNAVLGGLLFITSKASNVLYVCDALTGDTVRTLGEEGSKLGQFNRPNGTAVIDDLLLVTERGNQRVQVFSLPELVPLLAFGEDRLIQPYGLSVHRRGSEYHLYVTDNYNLGLNHEEEQSREKKSSDDFPQELLPGLGQRVKHYILRNAEGKLSVDFVRAFGSTEPAGALLGVESVLVDPDRNALLLCDEVHRTVKVYDLDGNFTGREIGRGVIQDEPEGLAILDDPTSAEGGYLVVTDQGESRTRFRVFTREGGSYLGAFSGSPLLANTDGITVVQGEFGEYSGGVLYAVHDDLRVQGYAVAPILELLRGLTSARANPALAANGP